MVRGGRGSGGGECGSVNGHDAPYTRDRAWHRNPLGNPHGVVDVSMDDGREGDDVWQRYHTSTPQERCDVICTWVFHHRCGYGTLELTLGWHVVGCDRDRRWTDGGEILWLYGALEG